MECSATVRILGFRHGYIKPNEPDHNHLVTMPDMCQSPYLFYWVLCLLIIRYQKLAPIFQAIYYEWEADSMNL